MNKSLAFKHFFGISPDFTKDSVIITNITSIYTALMGKAIFVREHLGGFYSIKDIKLDNEHEYQLIKILPGNSCIDVIKLLAVFVKKVYFIGIAGSLNSRYMLGDVYEPNEFVTPHTTKIFGEKAICQTSGLIQTKQFYTRLHNRGVSFVDMECYDIYRICRTYKITLKYIIQVSDCPIVQPFYEVPVLPIKINQIIELIEDDKESQS